MAKKSKKNKSIKKAGNNHRVSPINLKQSRRKTKLRKERISNKASHYSSDDRFETALKYLREGRFSKARRRNRYGLGRTIPPFSAS